MIAKSKPKRMPFQFWLLTVWAGVELIVIFFVAWLPWKAEGGPAEGGLGAYLAGGAVATVVFAALRPSAGYYRLRPFEASGDLYARAYPSRLRVERVVRARPLRFGAWLRGQACLWLIYLPHLIIALAVLFLLPLELNVRAALVLVGGAIAVTMAGRGDTLIIACWLGLARRASPRVLAVLETTAARVGVRPRGIYELAWHQANAFAFPLSKRLAVTIPCLEILTDDELSAIAAHELGHLAEPRRVAVVRMAGPYMLLAIAAAKPLAAIFHEGALLIILALTIVAPRPSAASW